MDQAKDLYGMANLIDTSINLAVEAFKATNVAQFNVLEISKEEVTD